MTESTELITILMVLGLILVTFAKFYDSKRFSHFVYLLGNSKYLIIHTKDQKFFDRFDALLFSNLVVSLSIFTAICFKTLTGYSITSADDILKLIVAITAFILIKVLLERLIGSLFEIDVLMDNYLFQKTSYKNYLGLLLIPINAFLFFNQAPTKVVLLTIISLFFIINLIGLIISFKVHQNILIQNFFYFILYLCALEIAPYVMIYKLLQESKVF